MKILNYKGANISFSTSNGGNMMLNATEMAKPFNKSANHWLRNIQTQEFLEELAVLRNSKTADLVKVIRGGSYQGTWLHEDVAIEFARWLAPSFSIWCNDRIKELNRIGFTATPEKLEEIINNPDLVIGLAKSLKRERQKIALLQEENEKKEETIRELEPKSKYYDEVLASEDSFTSTTIAKELGMSAMTLHRLLKSKRIIYNIDNHWVLYYQYQNKGYTSTRTFTRRDNNGNSKSYITTVWTQAGREFIHKTLERVSSVVLK